MNRPILLRVTTIDTSLDSLLNGQLKFLNRYYEVIATSSDTGKLLQVSEREGIRTIAIPICREINPFRDFISLIKFIRLCRREHPYIVHANTPKASLLSMVAAWICRVPHRIYTVTGLRFETTKGGLRFILKSMERVTCYCATKVIPEGDGVKATLQSEHITRKPLKKILNGNINGVDVEYFDRTEEVVCKAKEIRDTSSDFTFIFIGRMVRDKGIQELISAFDRLSKERKNIRLLLVGRLEEKLDPIPKSTWQMINENHKIVFTGYQNDIRPYLAASDAIVLPSYREGFPNVILQAGAMGLPSIVTDISGCNEIIENGKNGLIVPPKDEDALYEAMKYLTDNSQFTNSIASASRNRIVTKFNRVDVWHALLGEYQSLN